MKKSFTPILIVFAILIFTVPTYAANVPNFRRVAGDSVRGGKKSDDEGYHVYYYWPKEPLTYDSSLVNKYNALLQESGFELVDYETRTYRYGNDYGTKYYNTWFFRYKGRCVIFELLRSTVGIDGTTRFSVKVENGLTYEKD